MHPWLNQVNIDGGLETGEVTTKKPLRLPGRIRTHDLRNTCRSLQSFIYPLKQQRKCSCERMFNCLAAVSFQSTPLQK